MGTDVRMLQPGDLVPHFDAAPLEGPGISYRTIWQRQNLVLVALRPADVDGEYVEGLRRRMPELTANETALLITRDEIPGLPAPGILVADRWGEVSYACTAPTSSELPPPDEVLDWLRFTQYRCPECEGEWR